MLFETFFAVLASIVLLPVGTPKTVRKREVGGILICNGANATGTCEHKVYKLSTCYNMTEGFYKHAKTFAPDGEAFYCYPYIVPCGGLCMSPTGCTFGAVSFGYEHKYDLSAIGWDKYIASFDCHLNETAATTGNECG